MKDTIRRMIAAGKGLPAAGESFGMSETRLKTAGLESTEENRRAWRDLFFTAPGIDDCLGVIILFDKTMR